VYLNTFLKEKMRGKGFEPSNPLRDRLFLTFSYFKNPINFSFGGAFLFLKKKRSPEACASGLCKAVASHY